MEAFKQKIKIVALAAIYGLTSVRPCLAVTGEEFIEMVVPRLGSSTPFATNFIFFGLITLAVIALYIAVKINQARQRRAVEDNIRRYENYQEEVRLSRRKKVRRRKVKKVKSEK